MSGGGWRERWLLAHVAILPFLFGCVEPWSRALLEVSAFLLAAACLVRRGPMAAGLSPLAWGAALVAGLGWVQSLSASGAGAALNPWLPSTVSAWASAAGARLWLAYACTAAAASVLVSDRAALRRLVAVLFAAGALFAAAGIIQWTRAHFEIFGLRPVTSGADPFGSYYNRDHAAGFMAACAALGAGLIVSRAHSRRGRGTVGRLANLWATQSFLVAGAGLLLAGIWLTNSRGALLGLGFGAMLALFLAVRRQGEGVGRTLGRWAPGAAAIAVVVVAMVATGRLGWARVGVDGSAEARMAIWRAALKMIEDRPVWGSGLGAFEIAFPPYHVDPILSGGKVQHAHSDWLELACGLGLAGFAILAGCLAVHARWLAREWLRVEDHRVRGLWGGCVGAVIILAIHSLVEFNLQIPASMTLFVALASVCYPLRRAYLPPVPGGPAGLAARTAVILALGAAALSSAKTGTGWWLARRAQDLDLGERVRMLERARRLDPANPGHAREAGVAYLWLADERAVGKLIFARKALAAADSGLAATPDHPGLLEVKGTALWWLGDPKAGREALARARALQPWKQLKAGRAAAGKARR